MATANQPTTPGDRPAETDRGSGALTLLAGGLAIAAGIVAILVPALASVAVELFIGWVFVGLSGFVLVDAFSRHGFARIAFRVILAVATFAAGLYLLVSPLEGTFTLTVMLVIWFVAAGFTQIMIGIGEWKQPGAGLMVLSGVISLVLGVLIANRLPEAAAWAIGLLVGIQLVFYGFTAIAAWFAGRTEGRTA